METTIFIEQNAQNISYHRKQPHPQIREIFSAPFIPDISTNLGIHITLRIALDVCAIFFIS